MLRKIIDLFRERKIISLTDLSTHLKTEETAMEGMLQYLVRKKIIEHLHTECNLCISNCKTCPFGKEKDFYQLSNFMGNGGNL